MASVTFESVGKVYGDGTRAVDQLDIEIQDGEFMVLVGPSGCGKTTALRMVAGLEQITEGTVRIGDRVVNGLEPRKRDIAMVFQNYALYPHMTVRDNIAFGLKMHSVPRDEIARRVDEASRVLGLAELMKKKPRALSGGQRQRVAMGRAIVREPAVFLMDEPLSNLDARLRVQMRGEISRIQRELKATTLYVTHDQVEAMTMGDRVAVMRKGELQQVDVPQRLYDQPRNLFVASFIGSPSMNLVQAELGDDGVLGIGGRRFPLPAGRAFGRLQHYRGKLLALGIRPERVTAGGSAEGATLRGRVVTMEALGFEVLAHVEIDATPVVTSETIEVALDIDAAALLGLQVEQVRQRTLIVARLPTDTGVRLGDDLDLSLDLGHAHFFDLETGLAIEGD